jgi:hypothetical protein
MSSFFAVTGWSMRHTSVQIIQGAGVRGKRGHAFVQRGYWRGQVSGWREGMNKGANAKRAARGTSTTVQCVHTRDTVDDSRGSMQNEAGIRFERKGLLRLPGHKVRIVVMLKKRTATPCCAKVWSNEKKSRATRTCGRMMCGVSAREKTNVALYWRCKSADGGRNLRT